jgi:hypothetical protein
MRYAFLRLPGVNAVLVVEEKNIPVALIGHFLHFLPRQDLSFILCNTCAFRNIDFCE